jgi:hypothetical protein
VRRDLRFLYTSYGSQWSIIDQAVPGDNLSIFNGPECVDGVFWYRASIEGHEDKIPERPSSGWIPESESLRYVLEPI